jgi:hypothetical protein
VGIQAAPANEAMSESTAEGVMSNTLSDDNLVEGSRQSG